MLLERFFFLNATMSSRRKTQQNKRKRQCNIIQAAQSTQKNSGSKEIAIVLKEINCCLGKKSILLYRFRVSHRASMTVFFSFGTAGTVIVIVIVIGGLKSTGLAYATYSVLDKDAAERHPDYPRTIDARGCPNASNRISDIQIGLIRGFSFNQTEDHHLSTLPEVVTRYRTAQFLQGGEPQYGMSRSLGPALKGISLRVVII